VYHTKTVSSLKTSLIALIKDKMVIRNFVLDLKIINCELRYICVRSVKE
jgi:hypothetical protein